MYAGHLDLDAPLHWTLENVLSRDECDVLIARIEAEPRQPAPITTAAGFVRDERTRNNTRVMFDDDALARRLYGRVAAALPEKLFGWTHCGVNERFRCYRYGVGQFFAAHYDGCFERSDHERSMLTFMVYLNRCEGGATVFHDLDASIIPEPGRALFFQHRLLHEGSSVTRGVKYVLRSDVMYRAP